MANDFVLQVYRDQETAQILCNGRTIHLFLLKIQNVKACRESLELQVHLW